MASLKVAFLVCIAILAPFAAANSAPAPTPESPFSGQKFPVLKCIAFVAEATFCLRNVFEQTIAPHPLCCQAFAKLEDCSPSLIKDIPSAEYSLIKDLCASWGVNIP